MSQNSLTGVRSRHVDTRYQCGRRNRDNNSDIFTKNVNQEMYEKHAMKFLRSIEDFRSE
jgi:hypothetical protein